MVRKVDYKKDDRDLYLPKAAPSIIDVPKMSYFMISGEGDPNGEAYARAVEALYGLSYAVKMSYKTDNVPPGYYEYTVYPLEGVWDLVDYSKPAADKNNLKYTIMIRQPDFVTDAWFVHFQERARKKKPSPWLEKVTFGEWTDGPSCQMLHIGSYDDEPGTFAQMKAYCEDNGWERMSKTHREIYISDPRKTEPAKLKTVLRFAVKRR
ncbi:GyrI-like domain-containing protein [Marinicrinis lubricantis]|uniref:GyrI-like domain-containing protein n=1 Tax=Marinicrinis lubricantis TaxID=2086470 RepID=A0ABW1IKN8_9BACL